MTAGTTYPRSWWDVALDRGLTATGHEDASGEPSFTGDDFARVSVAIINGCPVCGATVAPYNSFKVSEEDDYAYCRCCAGMG